MGEEERTAVLKQLAEAWKKRPNKDIFQTDERTYITITGDQMEEDDSNPQPDTPIFNGLSPLKAYEEIESQVNPILRSTKRQKDGSFSTQIPRDELDLVIQLKEINGMPVKIQKHKFLNRCRGTTFSFDTIPMEEEEIKEALSEYRVTNVLKKKYFNKESKRQEYTGALVLNFDRETLPMEIKLGYLLISQNKTIRIKHKNLLQMLGDRKAR